MAKTRPGWLPNPRQELLLQAALAEPDRAAKAWAALEPQLDLDNISYPEFRMLPLLYRNLSEVGVSHPSMPRLKGIYKQTWYRSYEGDPKH